MQKLSPIYSLIRSNGSIVINKNLCHAIGLNETIIYSELLSRYNYFNERNKLDEDGFFFSTVNDLQRATCIGEKPQKKAINNLNKFGLIEYKIKGMPPKRYFKIENNIDHIAHLLEIGEFKINELKEKQAETVEKSRNRLLGGINSDESTDLIPPYGVVNNTKNNTKYNRVHCHELNFEEFKNILIKKGTPIDMDVVNSMQYFTNCRNKLFDEIKYNYDIWNKLFNEWLDVEVNGHIQAVSYEDSKVMIDKFFHTEFQGNEKGICDYSPEFYCSGKIKKIKFYDAELL
ncbi:hypothetical protein [Clostridium sp. HV4-5-A1G]|uniref:hypothetical protein n=1 Tax=Clostridium sp. HV4-5-A1G TaxID=2004595 RepID=UPI001238B9BA|nr:hypothetical protein [Clostridium sp. HV4-5-A1G]KAA8673382.1 hypothetical protein F3O63_08815 [Clostridium sp. HV4-5-A1G]